MSVDGDLIGDQQVLTSGSPMLLAVASGGGEWLLTGYRANGREPDRRACTARCGVVR